MEYGKSSRISRLRVHRKLLREKLSQIEIRDCRTSSQDRHARPDPNYANLRHVIGLIDEELSGHKQ